MSKTNDQQILQLHREFQDRVKTGRQDVLRNCYENVLFYLGHQWVTSDSTDHRFRRMNLRKGLPQPVTNKFKATMDTIIAVAARVEASLAIAPGSDEDADRLTADIAIHCIHYLEKIVSMTHLRLRLAPTLHGGLRRWPQRTSLIKELRRRFFTETLLAILLLVLW